MKRMLFNATHAEELRVAIVDGQKLLDLDLESAVRSDKKGNIYKAVVTKVEPSLEAAFVNYGTEKQGFLPLKEIYREYFINYDGKTPISNIRIEDVIKEGQELVVQVDKDERGTKGAALTTFTSLVGRFLVLMPNNPKSGGISRRISGEERAELRSLLNKLNLKNEHALIARTAGIGRSREELQWDLDYLKKLWQAIENASTEHKAPYLIYQETNLVVRSIRDYLRDDIKEIVIDDSEIYDRANRFMQQVMPNNLVKLKLYQDHIPLFSRFQIEHQIESAFNREVQLSSGGSITIDHTEALVSIDVNSARATRGGDIEETALHTNLEAVDEVARQLRIRDMGGLIVIDLIDMLQQRNQRTVEDRLKDALKPDRARVQVGKISRFGLLEMSRQRLRSSISDANYLTCPRCEGTGSIRSVVSSSLSLLRLLEEEALKENTEAIQACLPIDIATYLLNEKRHELNQLETKLGSRIIILPTTELESPHFQIKQLKSDELDQIDSTPSYKLKIDSNRSHDQMLATLKTASPEIAKIKLEHVEHTPPPVRDKLAKTTDTKQETTPGLFSRIKRALGTTKPDVEDKQPLQPESRLEDQPRAVQRKRQTKRGGKRRASNRKIESNRSRGSQRNEPNNENRPRRNKKKIAAKRTSTSDRNKEDQGTNNSQTRTKQTSSQPATRKTGQSKKKSRRTYPNRKSHGKNTQQTSSLSEDIGNR